jgi:hypothetical protein
LAKYQVKYLIVGGEAVIYYGHARLTGDLDVFFQRSMENQRRLYQALREFWAGDVPEIAGPDDLSPPGLVVQFGVPPNRIDLVNGIDGVDFEEAWTNRVSTPLTGAGQNTLVEIIGLRELIRNKQAVRRPRDQDDLAFLLQVEHPERS